MQDQERVATVVKRQNAFQVTDLRSSASRRVSPARRAEPRERDRPKRHLANCFPKNLAIHVSRAVTAESGLGPRVNGAMTKGHALGKSDLLTSRLADPRPHTRAPHRTQACQAFQFHLLHLGAPPPAQQLLRSPQAVQDLSLLLLLLLLLLEAFCRPIGPE